ncbi:BatD family protein [Candidatus Babeliales bacterium]|nr:BatD family protein [Candidatus Babeliales bacterium]
MVALFFLFFSFIGIKTEASIHISCENILHEQPDKQQSMMPTALMGRPFTIKIVTKGSVGNKSSHDIQLPESCSIISSSRSTSINMMGNNVSSSTTYIFDIIVNKEGPLTIGPITIDTISSNSIKMRVRKPTDLDFIPEDDDDEDAAATHSSQSPDPQMYSRIHAHQKSAYVGEAFIASRIIYHRGNIRKTEYEEVSSPQAFIKKIPGHLERTEIIKEYEYRVVEEQFLITPTKPGPLVIPAQQFVYFYTPTQQHRNRNDPFQMFLHALSPFELHQAQGVVSEITCTIKSLPDKIENVDAVGIFTNYDLTISRSKIHIHDTIQVTIRLKGFGNFDDIATPDIALPASCNTYAPTQKMIQEISVSQHQGIKEFSITVQPNQSGNLIIPEQIFSFFNPKTERIERLTTEETSCIVSQKEDVAGIAHDKPVDKKLSKEEPKLEKDKDSPPETASIIFDLATPLKSKKIPYIPWILFMLALLTPLIAIRQKVYNFFFGPKKQSQKETLLADLENALLLKQYAHAHKLIKKIFGYISKKPETFITESIIEQILTKKGCFISEINIIKEMYIQTLVNNPQKIINPLEIQKNMNIIKKLFMIFFFITNTIVMSSCSTQQDDIVQQSYSHIQEGKLEEAYTLLTSIPIKTALITKNLADVAFALEKNHAALFWYQAMQKKLALSEIKNHLYIISQKNNLYKKIDPTTSKSKLFLLATKDLFTSTPLSLWQIIFLFVWIASLYRFLTRIYRKTDVFIYAISIFCAALILLFSIKIDAQCKALTFNGTTNMCSGPDRTYDTVTQLTEQSLCTVMKKEPYFYKVKYQKFIGWINKKDLYLP